MPITREQFIEVETTVYEFWNLEMKKKKDFNALLYNVQSSEKSQENHLGIGSLGKMDEWTGSVSYEEFKKGFEKGYRHKKYSKGVQFEEEIFRFREYNKIKQRTSLLMDAVYKTLQAHGASTFNNAFDSSFKGPDGVELCSSSHPYSPTDATTQSNILTGVDLTPANLTRAFNQMSDFRDDKGDKVFTMPNILLTGIEYREAAMKICGPKASVLESYTAENDANIYRDLTYIYHPLITGKKWFLIDGDRMRNFLNWYNAREAVIQSDDDFDTEVMKFKVVGMFSYGWDHWDWVMGCTND